MSFFIDDSERTKVQHLNNSRLHLNKNGPMFFVMYISNDLLQIDKREKYNNVLNNVSMDDRNILASGHLNINSDRFGINSKYWVRNTDQGKYRHFNDFRY